MHVVLTGLLLTGSLLTGDGETDRFAPIRFLIGSWQGTGEGIGGKSTVTHTFEETLQGNFIRWRTRAVFAAEDDKSAPEIHEDIGFFSYDPARDEILLRQFLSEGVVNTYVVTAEKDGRLVMTTRHSEGSGNMRARLTLERVEDGKYETTLELAGAKGRFAASQRQVMSAQKPENWLQGIDVSHFSGAVDWDAVEKAGHRYAFLKATEGEDWLDPTFKDNMAALEKAGIARGAYHFFIAHDDPEVQARHFIEHVTLAKGDLPPVVDVETLSNRPVPDLPARLKKWLDLVEAHYGVKPIIYTSPKFWDHQVGTSFAEYPLWVAEYGVDLPRIPIGWERWTLWQYSGDAKPTGVTKTADLNYLDGKNEALERLRIP